MPLVELTEDQYQILREYVVERANDAGFNTELRGPFEFLIAVIVSDLVPSFSSSNITNYLKNKLTERLLKEKATLQARITEIDMELNR